MQDNGSWRGPAYVWKAQGIRNSYWQEISFGDGFDVVPDRDDSRYGWSMSQQGSVSRYDHITGNNYTVKPTHPDADMKLRFNWNSAINIDPFSNSTVYFGSQFVHKSTDKGLTWSIISPDLTTNDPEKQKQSASGGLTMDATGAENHTTILVIEPSPVEKDMMWVGTDDGRVHYTLNGGGNWTDVSKNIKGLPTGSWIVQIKASNKNKGEALLVANDYRRFNYTPYAYRTKNYGKTWERIVNTGDVQSYTLCILEDPINANLMFLGTDDGLYVSFNAGQKWTKWHKDGFPTTSVKDLVIQEREHDLVIGTFGRAAWVLDDIRPLRAMAKNPSILNKKLQLFEPPTAYQASYQQPTGSRFGGDALYNGENKSRGAHLSYFIKVEEKKKEEKKDDDENDESDKDAAADSKEIKWDSIHINIYDGERLIRSLKRKTPDSTGVHKTRWFMDEKGVDRPSRTIRKRTNEAGGVDVKPGSYKVVMKYGDQSSEQMIKVESDPRLQVSQKAINESYSNGKQIEAMQQIMADAVKQLVESKNAAKEYQSKLSKEDKKKYKDEIKASKDITKAIDSVIALYIGKEDMRQGITRNPEVTVSQLMGTASYYGATRPNGITNTELTLMKNAKTALEKALAKTNTFFTTEWKTYEERMKKIEVSPFKETKTFRLE
jgi:hypothetical protein